MIESTDELYENIADNIRMVIEEPWDRAELTIRLRGNEALCEGHYFHGDRQGSMRVSAFSSGMKDDLQKLHELTTTGAHKGHADWHEGVFTLYKDGHYEMRFLPKTA
jgi:hypothetical protein